MTFEIKERFWTLDQQQHFAALSGDYNPAHIDPVESRRTVFGKLVVHGIHTVVWALEEYFLQIKTRGVIRKLKAVFRKSLGVDERIVLSCSNATNQSVTMTISHDSVPLIDIFLEWVPSDFERGDIQRLQRPDLVLTKKPRVLSAQEIIDRAGSLPVWVDLLFVQHLFPALWEFLPIEQIVLLINTTRLVGMECPGLHSIYNELDFTFKDSADIPQEIKYKVKSFNSVFNIIQMQVDSSLMQGQIKAFLRPQFRGQLTAADIKTHIVPGEFKGQKALIIGGSRGLGAVAAKILALGGADVFLTYVKGRADAEAIQTEVLPFGGQLRMNSFSVVDFSKSILDILPEDFAPTHIYYFATPFIFDGVKKHYSQELFHNFCDFYINGFWKIFDQVIKKNSLKYVFYPSSSALDELPSNMFEYSLAKAAGESLCAYINKYYPGIKIVYPRLTRLATDQTVSLVPVKNENPLPVLLEMIRLMKSKGS